MIVSLLTDYGLSDEFVGICHAVVRDACPDCSIVDLTHGVPRHDVRHGAVVLANALPYVPVGVHVAVVDPEVGTERRAVAVLCEDGRTLVGPDNGLLSLAWERSGGAVEAVDISRSPHRLEPVSATFHGRDIFCAVGGRLAAGAELVEAGDRVDPGDLVTLDLPAPRVADGAVVAHAVLVDGFGNVALNLRHDQLAGSGLLLGRRVAVETGRGRHEAVFSRSFADLGPGELLVYEDAYRSVAIAVNRGDAAAELGLAPGDEIRLSAA